MVQVVTDHILLVVVVVQEVQEILDHLMDQHREVLVFKIVF